MIVEIACIVTDSDARPRSTTASTSSCTPTPTRSRAWTTSSARCTRSRDCCPRSSASTVSVADAQARTLEYVRGHVPGRRSPPLCGNSIGTDRRFLDRYMHELDALPALPQHRRVVAQGAVPALVPGDLQQATRARPSITARSTTSASRSRSSASTASRAVHSRRRPRRTFGCRPNVADVMSATAGSATTTPSWSESLATVERDVGGAEQRLRVDGRVGVHRHTDGRGQAPVRRAGARCSGSAMCSRMSSASRRA